MVNSQVDASMHVEPEGHDDMDYPALMYLN